MGIKENRKGGEKAYLSFKRSLEVHYSLLKNSSIWLRLVDGNTDTEVTAAIDEFTWFKGLGLYNLKPAKEYIEYQIRTARENYLAEISNGDGSGHGVFITPAIYSDETMFRNFFLDDNIDGKTRFKFLPTVQSDKESKHSENDKPLFETKDVALRILMVDDKISETKRYNDFKLLKCEDCSNCKDQGKDCKLKIIRELMKGSFISGTNCSEEKQKTFRQKTYWADEVHSFRFPHKKENNDSDINIRDIWEDDLQTPKDNHSIINDSIKVEDESNLTHTVQIVGVRDLQSALTLMSCCKFDLILLDYLLGKSNSVFEERAYSPELFEFLSTEFTKEESIENQSINYHDSLYIHGKIKEFQDIVKLNRGPLDKFWILPMTSYNSSFISDLQSKHVRLIDHRWNISQGADPINTPWKFLYKINELIDLQLRQSVFWLEQLLTFIQFTGEDLYERLKDWYKKDMQQQPHTCFDVFQQFMGAEYANLMKRYGTKRLIERDADGNGVKQSLFANYINKTFYNNNDNSFGIVTELNRLMQEFYHQAATMFDDRYGRQRLRESFERLQVFIAFHKLGDSSFNDKKERNIKKRDDLLNALHVLQIVIDSEFNSEIISNHSW